MLMITLFLFLSLSFHGLLAANIPPRKPSNTSLLKKSLVKSIPLEESKDTLLEDSRESKFQPLPAELEDLLDALIISNQTPDYSDRDYFTSPINTYASSHASSYASRSPSPNMATPKPGNVFYQGYTQRTNNKHGAYSKLALKAMKGETNGYRLHKASSADTLLAFQKYAQQMQEESDDVNEEGLQWRHSD